MDEEGEKQSVVVTFKCSPKFKEEIDEFSKGFDSRSGMIRLAIRSLMLATNTEWEVYSRGIIY